MADFLSETLGVAASGVMWDVGNFKLWQSTRPDVILFTAKQPVLAKGENGRYELAVTSYSQQQPDRSYKITGGSALFTITSAVQYDPKARQAAEESWRAAIGEPAHNAKFVALNVQKGEATVLINPMSGTPDKAHNDKDVGTPGGTLSFLVDLTELGAQEWVQGIKNRTAIPAGVKFMYEYLRMMPDVGAEVRVWGKRTFQHLSAALDVSVDAFYYGGSAKIDAAWEDLVRNGDIEITFIGGGLPPELEKIRTDLTMTFAAQAREIFFNQIFAPKPDVKPAQAGDTHGIFGGANFALKWKKESDAIDMHQTIKFKGWTWLKASMDADLGTLFSVLDPSYVTEVQTQQAFPASIVVDSDEMLSDVAYSMSFDQGHSPEASVFNQNGGNDRYVVVSQKPDDVTVSYDAKVNFKARWPIVEVKGSAKVRDGGNQIVIKPGSWVARHQIYMFVRDGNHILAPTELTQDDYLILNVSYAGPHLPSVIRDSAHLSGLDMIEFAYPLDPRGRPGTAKFSAFGVIGGRLVRASDQVIAPDETAVFVLASKDGKIQLVSKDAVIGEDDSLAQDLLAAGARPVLVNGAGAGAPAGGGARPESGSEPGSGNGQVIEGTTMAVEYGPSGPGLWISLIGGKQRRVLVRNLNEAEMFTNARKHVKVTLDNSGTYADNILVQLD